jgi:hypothetical protein
METAWKAIGEAEVTQMSPSMWKQGQGLSWVQSPRVNVSDLATFPKMSFSP